ncbi:MAG: hypothetical protein VYE81_06635, partial [Planctomycetota bacterium]|nr:hypothetical protein [Planctomycetota bacterium]
MGIYPDVLNVIVQISSIVDIFFSAEKEGKCFVSGDRAFEAGELPRPVKAAGIVMIYGHCVAFVTCI